MVYKAPYEKFDLDVLSLSLDVKPKLPTREQCETRAYRLSGDRTVFSFGTLIHEDIFSSLNYYNTQGVILLTDLSEVDETRDGFRWRGHVAMEQLVETTLFEALRYLWVQSYRASINGIAWIEIDDPIHTTNSDILGHLRGRTVKNFHAKLEKVRKWFNLKMQEGRKIYDKQIHTRPNRIST